jgi:quinol-cytochrome oxidoreductase complex cytochrome b subunit
MCVSCTGPNAFWRSRRNPSLFNQILKIILIVLFMLNFSLLLFFEVVVSLSAMNTDNGQRLIMVGIIAIVWFSLFWFTIVNENLCGIGLVIITVSISILKDLFSDEKSVVKYSHSAFQMFIDVILLVFGVDVCRGSGQTVSYGNNI